MPSTTDESVRELACDTAQAHTINAVGIIKSHYPIDHKRASEEEKASRGEILKSHVVVLYGMV